MCCRRVCPKVALAEENCLGEVRKQPARDEGLMTSGIRKREKREDRFANAGTGGQHEGLCNMKTKAQDALPSNRTSVDGQIDQ